MPAQKTFPRRTLDQALRVARALKEKNGGNPWPPEQVANALGLGAKGGHFYYIAAASRDYGLTTGSRDTAEIAIADIGRRAVYPPSDEAQAQAYLDAFLNVDLFKKVLAHYGGSNLPEKQFLSNTLQTSFGLDPKHHDEFVEIFTKNCRFLGIEVLTELFTPAGAAAGFTVKTAKRQGSDIIQSTIVNDLLEADLVLADLTEHNPNVLFELGMRMHADLPVALVRARGTGAIFDVDNMLRVEEYDPNLWTSSVKADIPVLTQHIEAAWDTRDTAPTFMKILRPIEALAT